ncbi:MAG TPA: hypothetical protein VLI54_01050 [Bacillota bacterium]|nr:hypothetical protein [Bacillota bacterium]
MSLKLFLGVLSLLPAAIAYFLYFRAMFSGKIKPHAFSWLDEYGAAVSASFEQVLEAGVEVLGVGVLCAKSAVCPLKLKNEL